MLLKALYKVLEMDDCRDDSEIVFSDQPEPEDQNEKPGITSPELVPLS